MRKILHFNSLHKQCSKVVAFFNAIVNSNEQPIVSVISQLTLLQ